MKPFSALWKWLFLPATILYQLVTALRNYLYDWYVLPVKKVDVPVISIGNLTVGGTGKTPFTAWLSNEFLKKGKRVAVVSRGYHRSSTGFVLVSDGKSVLVSPQTGGDEPVELAESCPGLILAVGEDRFQTCQTLLNSFSLDVIILDDGFQHRRLHRDFNIVLQDWKSWSSNRWHLPSGPYRERLSGFNRADWIGLTKWPANETPPPELLSYGKPVEIISSSQLSFSIMETGLSLSLETLIAGPCMALAGIAQPELFFNDLAKIGIPLHERLALPDHSEISEALLSSLSEKWNQQGWCYLIVTAKDSVKLRKLRFPENLVPIVARQTILPSQGLEDLLHILFNIIDRQ